MAWSQRHWVLQFEFLKISVNAELNSSQTQHGHYTLRLLQKLVSSDKIYEIAKYISSTFTNFEYGIE